MGALTLGSIMKRILAVGVAMPWALIIGLVCSNCATTGVRHNSLGVPEKTCIDTSTDPACDPTTLEYWEDEQFKEWLKKHG